MQPDNRRSGWIAIIIVVIALLAVGALAFGLGLVAAGRGAFDDVPMYGYGMRGAGFGLGGLLWLLLLFGAGALFVILVVRALEHRDGPPPAPPSGPLAPPVPPVADGVDRLRQLAEMHEQGTLTDEEFTAAKRRLLGL